LERAGHSKNFADGARLAQLRSLAGSEIPNPSIIGSDPRDLGLELIKGSEATRWRDSV
jgi:hypothetical protein